MKIGSLLISNRVPRTQPRRHTPSKSRRYRWGLRPCRCRGGKSRNPPTPQGRVEPVQIPIPSLQARHSPSTEELPDLRDLHRMKQQIEEMTITIYRNNVDLVDDTNYFIYFLLGHLTARHAHWIMGESIV